MNKKNNPHLAIVDDIEQLYNSTYASVDNSEPAITLSVGSRVVKFTEKAIYIDGEEKDVDKDWAAIFNEFSSIISEYNRIYRGDVANAQELEHKLSVVLDAATGGKWSKTADTASMVAVIHDYQEELLSKLQDELDTLNQRLQKDTYLESSGGAR